MSPWSLKRALPLVASVVLLVAYVCYDVYLLTDRLGDVTGNLEASVIWGTPAAVLFLVRSELRHRQRMAHLDSLHAKVDLLHQHLGVEPTAD